MTLAAAEQPLVIVLDDLHWSDQSSLDLLEFISRDIAGKSLLLLGGYRDVELSRRHPLSETLASLARVREFQRIVLRGLDNDDVGRRIESLVHIGLSAKQIDLIHGRTEGNPFFVTEVTRDMARVYAEQGEDFDANRFKIPEGVRQAVGIRLNKLSDECNKLLQIAAVIGREFDFKLLVELDTDLSEDALLELIDEATNAGMIRESSDRNDRYEFSHALVAQTLAEELSTGRRIRMHARIVEAMERLYEGRLDEHVAELIHHCREADTVVSEEKIAHYALLAGQRSAAAYAPIEARGYFELAFEVIDEIRSATDRAAILANLGRAELLTLPYPDIQRGWDHTKQAFDFYCETGDDKAAIKVALNSKGFQARWIERSAEVYARAMELAGPKSIDAGYLLVQYAEAIRFESPDHSEATDALKQALGIATDTGAKHLETQVVRSLAIIKEIEGDLVEAKELSLRALALARETNQPFEEASIHVFMAQMANGVGDIAAAAPHMDAVLRLESQYGFKTIVLWSQYLTALQTGELESIAKFRMEIERDHADDSVFQLMAGIGAWHSGEFSDLDSRFQAATEEMHTAPTPWQRSANAGFMVTIATVMNRPDDIKRGGEMALSMLADPDSALEIEKPMRIAVGLAAVESGDAQGAAEQYEYVSHGSMSIAGSSEIMWGDRILGLIANAAGLYAESDAHFEEAMVACARGHHMEGAWSRLDYAAALMDRSPSVTGSTETITVFKKVDQLLNEAQVTADRIGSDRLREQLVVLQQRATAMTSPATEFPDGLTAREVEVLQHLAAGRSNQQIADELVIAHSTIATHVASILGKTSSSNRTEAAAYALRQGLIEVGK